LRRNRGRRKKIKKERGLTSSVEKGCKRQNRIRDEEDRISNAVGNPLDGCIKERSEGLKVRKS